ncbi:putative lyase [Chromobacterium violaceum]|uniref:Putative lyase n=1 Tax=Chromobacterium violaceum TaxID=536 RepID=A0A447TC59_CHRVL|nr:putative lyase [Chromobacterium violaceum]
MHITGLHHVAIIASDYARSRDFYCRILGLKVIAENWRADRQSWKLDLALPGGGQLELFSFPAPRPAPPGRKPAACATWRWPQRTRKPRAPICGIAA